MQISPILSRSAAWAGLVLLGACGGPSDIGGGCDLADDATCLEDLVCAEDADMQPVCQIPLGGECDVAREPSGCIVDSECVEVTETVDGEEVVTGRCLTPEGGSCDPLEPYCAEDLTCAELEDGTFECHAPLLFRGRVIDSTTEAGIEGAHVIGLDDRSVAVSDIAVSMTDGAYELEVPVVRDAEGAPIDATFTLRGSADGYQTFPGGIRTALPISTSLATDTDEGWIVQQTLTDVVLIPLEDPTAERITVSGRVVSDTLPNGVLVVAEGADAAFSAISDASGAYTIFNVTPGSYTVSGYRADLQLVPVGVEAAATDLEDVDLVESSDATSAVSGSISIVNAFGGAATSVVLVVESTFSETFGRGEVPAGLRAPRTGPVSVEGAWTIEGVPAGTYVVLAAFENDLLVRDPDQNIAGTSFVTVTVEPGMDVSLSEAFKVTEALAVVSPGAEQPEAVTAAPVLEWADDSSEAYFTVQVFNAYGDMVWEDPMVPAVSGSPTVTRMYEGPLEPGMYYQFRATSWRSPGGGSPSPISTTEDLLGVFYAAP